MPWGWRGNDVAVGGAKGTPEEAAVKKAWPSYEAEYLAKRLEKPAGKYIAPAFGDNANGNAKTAVYFDKISHDYKQEADECLKGEFIDWLQGKHADNVAQEPYENGPGKPRRRYVYRDANQKGNIGAEWDNNGPQWQPTWWGGSQLTHLPGVREYLRQLETGKDAADLKMNLLAEHGPQDLDSAWMYFKHWVKGRPVGPEMCVSASQEDGMRSDFGRQMPSTLQKAPSPSAGPRSPPRASGTPAGSQAGPPDLDDDGYDADDQTPITTLTQALSIANEKVEQTTTLTSIGNTISTIGRTIYQLSGEQFSAALNATTGVRVPPQPLSSITSPSPQLDPSYDFGEDPGAGSSNDVYDGECREQLDKCEQKNQEMQGDLTKCRKERKNAINRANELGRLR